jgi:hypothetical protein
MSTRKKMLSPEELAGQAIVELPDRELLHVHKSGSHHGGSTSTTVICGSQNNSGNHYGPHHGHVFAPVNTHTRSCGSHLRHFRESFFFI